MYKDIFEAAEKGFVNDVRLAERLADRLAERPRRRCMAGQSRHDRRNVFLDDYILAKALNLWLSQIEYKQMVFSMKKPSVVRQILSFIISCLLLYVWPLFMMIFCSNEELPLYLSIMFFLGLGCPCVFVVCYVVTIIQLIRRRNPGIISMIPLYYLLFFYLLMIFSFIAIIIVGEAIRFYFP